MTPTDDSSFYSLWYVMPLNG